MKILIKIYHFILLLLSLIAIGLIYFAALDIQSDYLKWGFIVLLNSFIIFKLLIPEIQTLINSRLIIQLLPAVGPFLLGILLSILTFMAYSNTQKDLQLFIGFVFIIFGIFKSDRGVITFNNKISYRDFWFGGFNTIKLSKIKNAQFLDDKIIIKLNKSSKELFLTNMSELHKEKLRSELKTLLGNRLEEINSTVHNKS